jgi:hypothetical protein
LFFKKGLETDRAFLYRIFYGEVFLNLAFVFALLLFVGLTSGCVLPVLFRLFRTCRIEEITPEWLENFSISSYYLMQGLLSQEDFKFISRQPGFDWAVYRKFRRDRLRIFQQFLQRLILDFNRLHTVARVALAQSPDDQSALVMRLVWLKVRFSMTVLRVQFSYVFCFLGFPSLDVRSLIQRLEEMNARLSSISTAQLA